MTGQPYPDEKAIRDALDAFLTHGPYAPSENDARLAHDALAALVADRERYEKALRKIAGNDPDGLEGFHFVGDEKEPDECPGCWARWALQDGDLPSRVSPPAGNGHDDDCWIACPHEKPPAGNEGGHE